MLTEAEKARIEADKKNRAHHVANFNYEQRCTCSVAVHCDTDTECFKCVALNYVLTEEDILFHVDEYLHMDVAKRD